MATAPSEEDGFFPMWVSSRYYEMLKLSREKQLTKGLHEWNLRKNVIKRIKFITTMASSTQQYRSKVVKHQIATARLETAEPY